MGRDQQQFAGQDHWTCIRCGLCIEACPTYLLTLDEGASPRGRVNVIHALVSASRPAAGAPPREASREASGEAPAAMSGELSGGATHETTEPTWREVARRGRRLLDQCLLCRACEAVCPSGVSYLRMMTETRGWLIPRRPSPGDGRVRSWLRGVFPRPWLVRLALGQVRLAVGLRLADLFVRCFTPSEHHGHYLALIESLRVRLPVAGALERAAIPGAPGGRAPAGAASDVPGGKALIFRGCVTPVLFPAVLDALRSVLDKLGITHETPRRQVCCGALHRQHGLLEEARALARKNIAAFEAEGDPLILVESSGCAAALLDYADLLRGDTEFAERARRFSARVRDSAAFLAGVVARERPSERGTERGVEQGTEHRIEHGTEREGSAAPEFGAGPADPAAVLPQEPCHLRHGQRRAGCLGSTLAALGLAQPGTVPEADVCCGGAGLYSLLEPAMSARLGERKADLLAAGATGLVITSDPGCRLQLQGRLARRGVAMLHVAELCDRRWR